MSRLGAKFGTGKQAQDRKQTEIRRNHASAASSNWYGEITGTPERVARTKANHYWVNENGRMVQKVEKPRPPRFVSAAHSSTWFYRFAAHPENGAERYLHIVPQEVWEKEGDKIDLSKGYPECYIERDGNLIKGMTIPAQPLGNFLLSRTPPTIFVPFDTNVYDKDFYWVLIGDYSPFHEQELVKCWPNAGWMNSTDGSGRMWNTPVLCAKVEAESIMERGAL